MTLTHNFMYQGADGPADTVCPSSLNPFIDVRRLNATADVADLLVAGVLCYLTSTTNASDMTPASAAYGDDSREGIICVVEIKTNDPYLATTTDKPVYPNKVPNTTCTITEFSPAANTNIIVIPIESKMRVWLLGSTDGTFDTTFGCDYICAANGLVTAPGDPDGVAPDIKSFVFTSIATTLNQNWALFKARDQIAYDKTA